MNPLVAAAAIGAGANLLGSVGSGMASAKAAQKQMDFQERMSNTAYQRSAKDLELAGLNRILAIGSPATTPGGAMAQIPDYGASMSSGAQTGMGIVSGAQSVAQSKAQEAQIIAQTEGISAENKKKIAQSKVWEFLGPLIQSTAGQAQKLIDYLSDPATQQKFKTALAETAEQVKTELPKLLKQYFQDEIPIKKWYDFINHFDPIGEGAKAAESTKNWIEESINKPINIYDKKRQSDYEY